MRALSCAVGVAAAALAVTATASSGGQPWAIANLVGVARQRFPRYVNVRPLRLAPDGAVYWTAERDNAGNGAQDVFRWRGGRTADLGSPGRGLTVVAVNSHEQFVVETTPKPIPSCIGSCSFPEPPMHAYLWQRGKLVSLGSLGGTNTYAVAIDEKGQIVGWSNVGNRHHDQHAFVWQDGKMTDIGTLGGTSSYATAINDRGQVIGTSSLPNPNRRVGFLWQSGKLTDLGTLGGGTSIPVAINSRGQVIGQSTDAAHPYEGEAFFWQHGTMTDIGTLDLTGYPISCEFNKIMPKCDHPCPKTASATCKYWRSVVTAIDDRGDVVGMTETDSSAGRAFLWHAGKLTDLGTLRGWSSGATAVDDQGDVVGWSETKRVPFTAFRAPGIRPFLWHGGRMTELPTLVGEPTQATAIGAGGLAILGAGEYGPDGNQLLLWRRATS